MMKTLPELLHLAPLTAFIAIGSLLSPGCGPRPVETRPDVQARYHCDALRVHMNYPIDEVYQAADRALKDLNLKALYDKQDGVAAQIDAFDAQQDWITVGLVALPYSKTEMTIRAGLFGNRNKSDVVFERTMEVLRGEPEKVQP